jgi:putative CGCGG family rSAM target protein
MPDHTHDVDPITEETHDNSWSANLELEQHAADRDLLVEQALTAVERTAPGNHVNLVTHADHGHPEEYLFEVLATESEATDWAFVEQCGCGGYVTRVEV